METKILENAYKCRRYIIDGRNKRWQLFRTRGKMPHFCFCKFFYLLFTEDILAVGPGNCRIYLTLTYFILSLKVVPACLLARTELFTQKQIHDLMKRKLGCTTFLSDIGYITPPDFTNHRLWLVYKQKPSFLAPGKSSAELSKM